MTPLNSPGFKNLARNVKAIAQKIIEKNVMVEIPGMPPFFLASKLFGQDSVLPLSTGGHDEVDAVGTRFENIPDVRDFVDPYAGDNDTYEAPQQYINLPEVVSNDQYTTPTSLFGGFLALFSDNGSDNDGNEKPEITTEEIVDALEENGAKYYPNPLIEKMKQEVNGRIDFADGTKVNIRVETHPLPKSEGQGDGDVRHANVDVIVKDGSKNVTIKNKHIYK